MKLRNNEHIELRNYKFKFIDSGAMYSMCGLKRCCECKLFANPNSLCDYALGLASAEDRKLSNMCELWS